MKILRIETWSEQVPLSKPYTIALTTTSTVQLFFLRIICDQGPCGIGSAAPFAVVTGETSELCAQALDRCQSGELEGWDPRAIGKLIDWAETALADTPAARAAFDMACWDLHARIIGLPLVDLWGRCHADLPTSVTIGIMSTEDVLAEAEEYLGQGFTCLKVKLGLSLEQDMERLRKLRAFVGKDVQIRVDANQGYDLEQTVRFLSELTDVQLEFLEQPMPTDQTRELLTADMDTLSALALDESLQHERDALQLSTGQIPTWVIKLMKCGGPTPALTMARIANLSGKHLMIGCMDESCISIAAGLHVAYASPATRYLDLDGSFDLARDPGHGGFELVDGRLRTLADPGLGAVVR